MTRAQRVNEWDNKLSRIVAMHKRINQLCDDLTRLGLGDPDGRVMSTMLMTLETLIEMIDYYGWVAWFIHDNDCGRKSREIVRSDGKHLWISTTLQMANVIVFEENAG